MLSAWTTVVNLENIFLQKKVFQMDKSWYYVGMEAKDVGESLAEGVQRLMDAQSPPWTQSELAKQLGWSRGNVSRLMSVRRTPNSTTLAQLATVFKVEVCELFCDCEKPKKKKK